jgi:hypothetical protein
MQGLSAPNIGDKLTLRFPGQSPHDPPHSVDAASQLHVETGALAMGLRPFGLDYMVRSQVSLLVVE